TLRLLERCDAIRKPLRMAQILQACECDARGRLGLDESPYPQADRLHAALAVVLAVDTSEIATRCMAAGQVGPAIGKAIALAREAALSNPAPRLPQ
ncbi:MAG: multifunctional CCA tRNA nucleotidyl transferase/2'3'-cyclic phosphodiesterase/2'nucleotidase/phosphatase, partial [Pseudomonadota bacterium]